MVNDIPGRADDHAVNRADGQAAVDLDQIAPDPVEHGDGLRLLHTPAQAARVLSVRESWLRRMAGRREIPCTFLGKHLRFSDADLLAIVRDGARTARGDAGRPSARSGGFRRR
ncbi:helix-turn-helix domain-containing protein [Actinosynnema sp. NPDC023658]|uniref:helix-turn-helix domain-containing protein n=1 Tax=Actinosynnema sp. NPDC023658 TaxID=3155465 RepID=UPI0033FBF9F7